MIFGDIGGQELAGGEKKGGGGGGGGGERVQQAVLHITVRDGACHLAPHYLLRLAVHHLILLCLLLPRYTGGSRVAPWICLRQGSGEICLLAA